MKNNQIRTFMIMLAILLTFQLSESNSMDKTFVEKVEGVGYLINAIQTTDGNFLSVSRADATRTTYVVRKVTPLGQEIWERSLSVRVADGGYWDPKSLVQTTGGYVLVGGVNETDPGDSISEGIAVALYSDGTVNWTKRFAARTSFGAKATTWFTSGISAADGGFIVKGDAYQAPRLLVKLAADGSIQWQKSLSFSFGFLSSSFRFLSTSGNGFILAGKISNGADIVKVDNSGNIAWSRTLTNEGFSLETLGYDAAAGIVIAGKSKDSKILSLIRLESNGRINWTASYSLDAPFLISGIVTTPDGGYALTGAMKGNGFVLKFDAQKRLVFQRTIAVPGTKAMHIFATDEGAFALFGSIGKSDLLFLRVNSDGLVSDCPYFHNMNSKAVRTGVIKIRSSTVTSQPVTLLERAPFEVRSKKSRHTISSICE